MLSNRRQNKHWIRILARTWGTLAASYWGLLILAYAIGGEDEYAVEGAQIEGILLAILIVCAVVSTIYAWRNEHQGGLALLVVGFMLSVFALITAGRNHLFAMMVSGVPFMVSGALFLLADRAEEKLSR